MTYFVNRLTNNWDRRGRAINSRSVVIGSSDDLSFALACRDAQKDRRVTKRDRIAYSVTDASGREYFNGDQWHAMADEETLERLFPIAETKAALERVFG